MGIWQYLDTFFGVHKLDRNATGIYKVEVRDAIMYPAVHRTAS